MADQLDAQIMSIVERDSLDITHSDGLEKLRSALGADAPSDDLRGRAMEALERRLAHQLLQLARDRKLDPADLDDMETLAQAAGDTNLSAVEVQAMVQQAAKQASGAGVAVRAAKTSTVTRLPVREFKPSITRIDSPLDGSARMAELSVKVVVKGNF